MTGTTAGFVSAMLNSLLTISADSRGLTPSWTATIAPSGTADNPFLTDWNRVNPPGTIFCGQMKLLEIQ